MEHRFGIDFGRVLEWFLEAKILDFRTFWNFFPIKIHVKLKLRKKIENCVPYKREAPPQEADPLRAEPSRMALWPHIIEKQAPRLGENQILAFWPRPHALELRSITLSNTPMA